MWLLLVLTAFFAIVSIGMRSYLVMHLPLGPWIGPIFEAVFLILLVPIISKKWFQDHAIITLAAASIGGMIGLSLGMTLPSFYFLYRTDFLAWLAQPLWFMSTISLFVFCAGLLSFLIAYVIKDHLILDAKLPFPMSKLIYDMISVGYYTHMHKLIWIGIAISSLWNGLIFFIKTSLIFNSISLMYLYMIPTIVSIGFFVGHITTISLFIGLIYRILGLEFLHKYYFVHIHTKEFLVMFCLGMLFVHIAYSVILVVFQKMWKDSKRAKIATMARWKAFLHNKLFLTKIVASFFVCGAILYCFGVSLNIQCFVFPVLILVGFNVARIVGEMGILDIDSFVWCVLLPLIYIFTAISLKNLALLALFICLCLGIVVNLVFSYKLAFLANISYQRILNYQIFGFFIAVFSSGIFMWYQAQYFDEQSLQIFALNAQTLNNLMQLGTFNYQVFMCGIIAGLLVIFVKQPLLVVVGAMLMSPFVLMCLLVSGMLAYFVVHKEKLFPLWLGVYAAHAAWMMIWAVL